jgi:hypothetical protein
MSPASTIVIAAMFGCGVGAVAAVTSGAEPPRRLPRLAVVGPVQASAPRPSVGTMPRPVGTSLRVTDGVPPVQPGDPTSGDRLLLRARALSRQPDVQALVGMRRDFLQEARRRGVETARETKQRLAALDRALHEARLLRLKLDGEQLRRSRARKP